MIISITGTGAVTPAGWGVSALMDALSIGKNPEVSHIERLCGEETVRTPVYRVPTAGATTPKFARLRRSSPISKFAAAAVAEALGEVRLASIQNGERHIGIIFTLMNGCVNYSNRFFGEVMADPSVASPILFPETVFNAPSSHLSALLGSSAPNDTLITDGSGFFSAMDLAAEWISRGEVDGCLVVASEEIDWLSAEGLQLYAPDLIACEGAAAIFIEAAEGPVRLLRLPDPIPLSNHTRTAAALALRKSLAASDDSATLLVDGTTGNHKIDAPEIAAWEDWAGPRLSPRIIMGEGLGVSAALQVVAGCEAIKSGIHPRAVIIATGGNQHAAGALLGN